ncbi:MAG TPA: ribbon-helix-helix protein, CopG family [Thermoanaerobaculia bacterium]|nr:ribbon-helix-helix protein, CopG family [Thermoanaerobaculia bacterium]
MSRIVTLRLDDTVYDELKEAAAAERRSLSNLIENAALAKIREERFADDAEMREILMNERLTSRLRKGSRDAARRKGRFVE